MPVLLLADISPYFCTDTVFVCTIVMSGTCANVMDSCPIRKNPNPYVLVSVA